MTIIVATFSDVTFRDRPVFPARSAGSQLSRHSFLEPRLSATTGAAVIGLTLAAGWLWSAWLPHRPGDLPRAHFGLRQIALAPSNPSATQALWPGRASWSLHHPRGCCSARCTSPSAWRRRAHVRTEPSERRSRFRRPCHPRLQACEWPKRSRPCRRHRRRRRRRAKPRRRTGQKNRADSYRPKARRRSMTSRARGLFAERKEA